MEAQQHSTSRAQILWRRRSRWHSGAMISFVMIRLRELAYCLGCTTCTYGRDITRMIAEASRIHKFLALSGLSIIQVHL